MSVTSNTSTEELKPYCVDEYTIEKRILVHFKDKRWHLTKYHHVLKVPVPHGHKMTLKGSAKDQFKILYEFCFLLNSDQEWLDDHGIFKVVIGSNPNKTIEGSPWPLNFHPLAISPNFNQDFSEYNCTDCSIIDVEGAVSEELINELFPVEETHSSHVLNLNRKDFPTIRESWADAESSDDEPDEAEDDTIQQTGSDSKVPRNYKSAASAAEKNRSMTPLSITTSADTETETTVTVDEMRSNPKLSMNLLEEIKNATNKDVAKYNLEAFNMSKDDLQKTLKIVEELRTGIRKAMGCE